MNGATCIDSIFFIQSLEEVGAGWVATDGLVDPSTNSGQMLQWT